ncbi:MAG: ABC transporter permease, partial [Bacteroidota bacterium]
MKLAFQLAYKNLIGAGLRTWLNVAVLAFSFLIILFFNGILDGWNQQAKKDSIAWEYGHGHLVNDAYDPYDPFSIQDGHGKLAAEQNLSPILIRQASIYPEGRMLSVALKGIDVEQKTLEIPSTKLKNSAADFPVIIGERMAETAKLKKGDEVLLRWRDKNGTFDAASITIVEIFKTDLSSVDNGQLWIDIERLWEMTDLENHATLFVANEDYEAQNVEG